MTYNKNNYSSADGSVKSFINVNALLRQIIARQIIIILL